MKKSTKVPQYSGLTKILNRGKNKTKITVDTQKNSNLCFCTKLKRK